MDSQQIISEQYGYKLANDNGFCNGVNSFGTPNPIIIGSNIYEFMYFKTGGNMFDPVYYKGINCPDTWLTIDEIRKAKSLVRI